MKISMPITREKIKTHLSYAWWQYVLVIALSILGWNLLYTTTHYRSPEHLKVEWYCDSQRTETQASMDALMDDVHASVLPDMEEVSFIPVFLDETYGDMQMTVWFSAGEGDVFMLAREAFENMSHNGALADLTPYLESGALNAQGLELSGGRFIDPDTGKSVQTGIPAEGLSKLQDYGIACDGELLGLSATGGNIDNAVKLLNWLIQNMQ